VNDVVVEDRRRNVELCFDNARTHAISHVIMFPCCENSLKCQVDQPDMPNIHQFVKNYVKGCTKYQESKVITHMKHAPLYHFNTHVE
jgi:hypothetical protein